MEKQEERNLKKDKRNKILVNCITAIRSLGSAAIVPIFLTGGSLQAAIASILFFGTDCIDGFLARRLHVQSFFGSLLDGMSDKLFGIVCLLLLGTLNPIFLVIPAIEIGILAVNYKSIERGNNAKSSKAGKLKTVLLAASIAGGFFSYAAPSLKDVLNYINASSLYTLLDKYPDVISTLFAIPAIAASIYVEKDYLDKAKAQDKERDNNLTEEAIEVLEDQGNAPTLDEIERMKAELLKQREEILVLKSKEEIKHDLFDTEFYLNHCDDGIKRLLYKRKSDTDDKVQ